MCFSSFGIIFVFVVPNVLIIAVTTEKNFARLTYGCQFGFRKLVSFSQSVF